MEHVPPALIVNRRKYSAVPAAGSEWFVGVLKKKLSDLRFGRTRDLGVMDLREMRRWRRKG